MSTENKAPNSYSTPYINRAAVRRFALQLSKDTRAGKFTRVSEQFLVEVNAHVAAHVRAKIHSAPSVGKTL